MAITYKVKWGDTLWDLSRKYGVTIDAIVKANKQIKDPHWIYTGDTLIIPTGSSSGSSSASSSSGSSTSSTSSSTSKTPNYETGKPTYKPSGSLADLEKQLEKLEAQRPGEYNSQYSSQISAIVDQILNQKGFSYDLNADPVYQQYRTQYMQAGQLAMRDTQGQAAALTGGYGSSYAVTAGSQAYSQYLTQLNEQVPELYNAAYSRYQGEQQRYLNQMNALLEMDEQSYSQYRDQVSDYQKQLDYYKSRYEDQRDQEYKEYLEKLEAWQEDRDYGYQKAQDQKKQSQWEEEMRLKWNQLWSK